MIRSALVVAQPYADLIVSGEKLWELRPTHSHKRELIGIIAKGSGTIIGLAAISASRGPLSITELAANQQMHRVSCSTLNDNPKWNYAWELDKAVKFVTPVPYHHPEGAQGWVNISPATALRVAYQVEPGVRRCFPRA